MIIDKHISLHKRFPFLNSIISLVFGAVLGCLLQNIVDLWKNEGTMHQKVGACILFFVAIFIAAYYYRSFYDKHKKGTAIEEEQQKKEIQRIKKESELATGLFDQATKEMNNENLTIMEKTDIYKQIILVVNENKRGIHQNNE